ncbi:uncharacterized protein QC764_703920 [Podospora pseudoanserina]|uniref:Microtubule associated protein n=1 Tax=Podospora pseudoanserina TaxID=2609844 RepID=A0ABR0HIU9_9PEZI|nr:hypothetical protein QC764_703920 [Podospora pseudoanserina]
MSTKEKVADAARTIYNPLGFKKFYNFVLFFIFGGALLGFTLARFQYLSFDHGLCPEGGGTLDCYYYTPGSLDKIGIQIHLSAILPASFLAVFQFVPIIRYKLLLFHRVSGYLIVLLSAISTAGALMLVRNAQGGPMEIQLAIGVISFMFIVSIGLAIYNIKRLQIEQHRAWMLRAWSYAGSVVTMRLVMMAIAHVLSTYEHLGKGYSHAMPCVKVTYLMFGQVERILEKYPACAQFFDGSVPGQAVAVTADGNGDLAELTALYNMIFGAAFWLAFALHAAGVEIYVSSFVVQQLHLTPAEADRLRNVSYQKQLEAGMKKPGRTGLTADKLGDAPRWIPKSTVSVSAPGSGDAASDENLAK